MKNLSAIPRLSLSETFTILITLVVCLAGFTKAEVLSNYRKQDSNKQEENYLLKEALFKENVPYFHQTENGEKNVAKFKIIPETPLDRLIKRHSDEFGQSEESDERESDGYGYDDDEYYHFNFKRNDENLDNKAEKESVHDVKYDKEGVSGQKFIPKAKDKSKEMETIEMLNYKEFHPNIGSENNPYSKEGAKEHSDEIAHKKQPNTGNSILTSLKMSDLRENSAIDEKMKDRKDESGLTPVSTDSKVAETKKSVKGSEEKEEVKLKDSKLVEDSEKKDKEATLQDAKEAVIAKSLKENPKSSEEKEKGVKLSESAKLEENLEKISSKTKENDPSKITKEEIGIPRYAERVNSDVINPKGLSQINNRASFVSSDYKANLDPMKNAVVDEEEKSEEDSELPFQEDLRSREKLRKVYNERIKDPKYGLYNSRNSNSQMLRDTLKEKEYVPSIFDQSSNDYFKKRESWKESGGQGLKFRLSLPSDGQLTAEEQQAQQQFLQQMQQQQTSQDRQAGQHQIELTIDPQYKTAYGFTFPSAELENTDYHKNYMKSLKRYKSMAEEQKVPIPDSLGAGTDKNSYGEANKKKLQDTVKRSSMLSEKTSGGKESALGKHQKLRRNAYKSDWQTNQKCAVVPKTTLSLTKTENADTKLSDAKSSETEEDSSRTRRKSPLKLEYEIKVINQSPQDSKNAELSHSTSRRFEKDLKTKLATEDKYLKKYPYSQVSREDLMRLGESESEKKIKRRAPIWKRHDQKSVIQTRAVPSGYYGNRVKFGQKNYLRNNDKTNPEPTFFDSGYASSSYLRSNDASSMVDKNKNQRSWEIRQLDYKHDPMKRYDDMGNSLFLIKKGERKALPFEEGSPQSVREIYSNPDNLANILTKENELVILKKKDNKNLDSSGYSYSKFVSGEDRQGSLKSNAKQMLTKSKGLHARSFHSDKEDKKLSSAFHNSKSNLKKTFDKFRDLAGFFKDNEQETGDNQYPGPELKEGRDIVFSEDKLPDPIVISNDASGKPQGYNQKPQNSIFSISTNFKTLDQQQAKKTELPSSSSSEAEKNMYAAESKSDKSESVWEPSLKNIFPEAKSINSLSKNGNEIIILDLDRNRLKPSYGTGVKSATKTQPQAFGLPSQVPMSNPSQSDKKFQFLVSAAPMKFLPGPNSNLPQKSPFSSKPDPPIGGAYTLLKAGDGLGQFSFRDLSDIPTLIKALTENKPIADSKLITKRSPSNAENQVSDNYNNFLRDLGELSDLNKVSFRKGKLTNKREENEIVLPSSGFPELSTYGHANIKYLGNLLQSIMTGENPELKSVRAMPVEDANDDITKFLDDGQRMNPRLAEPDHNLQIQNRVSKASVPLDENTEEDDFQGEGDDQKYRVLFEGFEAASDKISRLRREDALKRKQKRTTEDSVAFRQKQEFDKPSASPDKCIKMSFDSIDPSDKVLVGEVRGDFKAELKSDDETKEGSEGDKSHVKSDYESHLNEFFENLNANKNQKHQLIIPSENTWRRKKRKDGQRRKRSASVDVKNKVSTTAVQNTILKNLAEDNYQSVYSPGIKRRLFSTSNGADDADNNSDAYERDKNVIAEEAQPKCVRNLSDKYVDPLIVGLFGAVDKEEEKNRARRSLTGGFHSNFKREIDLDESMPNDFQNFLMTSLGGFGSQKREVIKKDVAFWEGKESSQDNANQIVESSSGSKDAHEDSTLEKREVSSSESQKTQTYFPSNSDQSMADVLAKMNHGEKKIRSEDKSNIKSKGGFAEEKLPTQIRIQITNASSKEKKSSKPIMDESETTSAEMENLPKEKEFFDKNKINALRIHNVPKLHGLTKSKFSYSDYEEPDGAENTYRPYRRRRKKKKFVAETPMKPVKDFIKFDQKTMETFLKRIMADQHAQADQTTQKSSVSNHLPQVETVYNPTQGTNKAQLESLRFGKLSAANSKNSANVKNNLQSGDSMAYDEAIIRNYLKDKTDKMKSDKAKEYEEIDWKPDSGKMRLRQELGWEPPIALNLPKSPMADAPVYSLITDPPSSAVPFAQHTYGQKNPSPPGSTYFFHPPNTNSDNSYNVYDALKMKQEMKNMNAMPNDRGSPKMNKKSFYYNDMRMYNKNEDKEKPENVMFPGMSPGGANWNYDYSAPKKPTQQVFKGKDYYPTGIKNQNRADSKGKFSHGSGRKYLKNLEEEKTSILESPHSSPVQDNSKDSDYLDGVDDEYLEDDAGKDLQTEEVFMSSPLRKPTQVYETPLYHRIYNYKNSDVDDGANEEDEEVDEDYEETSEDDDLDDYSLLASSKGMEPELTRSGHDKLNSQSAFQASGTFSPFNCLYPKDNLLELKGHGLEQTDFAKPKTDVKFNQRRQQIPFVGTKIGVAGGTSGLLKKANENANIFEKNLMKGAYGYDFDGGSGQERLPEEVKELNALLHHDRLMKRKLDFQGKLKRSREYPQIGSRLFYAAKTEVMDDDSPHPVFSSNHKQKSRSSRHTYYRRNPLNAEFADPDNGFENDSEENGKHFNENLINFGKNFQGEAKTEGEDAWDLEDVAENLEDDGETISEDNVLENVIGKYIMRKRVASPADLNKASENSPTKENTQSEGNHKLNKRSLGKHAHNQKKPEIKIVKRLSSGHLTENNFRKYHKKNLSRKRDAGEFDFEECDTPAVGRNKLRKTRKMENPTQTKRSALDLFKKITNKDRDSKKAENVDGRTAGFEPLSSLNDKKYESSLKDAKFEFLNQLKKISNEGQQSPIKSNTVQLKSRFPYEGQIPLEQRKRERAKTTAKETPLNMGQGPWRIELNDQYKWDELSKSFGQLRELEAMPGKQDGGNLKAFLVFSNNLRPPKRSTAEDLPATSGSSQKEVGNSYRRKSGRGIYKVHVRKRSLDSSLVATKINNEDAAQTSRGHFAGEQITESRVDIAEKNRALHDSMSLSEGDSIPRLPRVLQRNAKKSRSFVNADEQCETGRFPSIGRLTNRKSVFPPSDDANILRDSRQVNEETSKYLGQQIVDSIMSHVSANPKFKLIAPGLVARTTAYKEGIDVKKEPVPQADVSDQLQYFLKKFMTDLEKLAEKHVRKRMCSQIDQQSKDFLQSLLNLPPNANQGDGDFGANKNCQNSGILLPESQLGNVDETATAASKTEKTLETKSPKLSASEIENLKHKHCLLKKLIDDYAKLSKFEKESIGMNYEALMDEFSRTNKDVESLKPNSPLSDTKLGPKVLETTLKQRVNLTEVQGSMENSTFLSPVSDSPSRGNDRDSGGASRLQPSREGCPGKNHKQPPVECPTNQNPDQKQPCILPVIYFDEVTNPQITITPPPVFESVDAVNLTFPRKKGKTKSSKAGFLKKENALSKTDLPEDDFNSLLLPSPIPQTFDLLPCQNSTGTAAKQHPDQPSENSESVRIKESVSGADTFENYENQTPNSENPNGSTELQKLSLGDAAGLQLSLKYRGPWVSNLDIVKSIRNVPGVPEPSKSLHAPKVNPVESLSMPNIRNRAADAPSLEDVKNSKSSFAPINGYRTFGDLLKRKTGSGYTVFPDLNFGAFLPKKRPFESVSMEVDPMMNERIPLSSFLRKASSIRKKRVFLGSNNLARSLLEKDRYHKSNHFLKTGHGRRKISPYYSSLPARKREKKRNKSEVEKSSENEEEKDAELEYLVWSTLPAVRRQLNNLEAGFELDELFMKNPKRKNMWKRGKGKLV